MSRFAQLVLVAALLGGAWWLGARSAQAQLVVLGLGGFSLLLAAISTSIGARNFDRLSSHATLVVVFMVVFLAMQAVRIANPAFVVHMDGFYWHLAPLPHVATLPAGFDAPFDGIAEGNLPFTNPLRYLIVFGAAFCITVSAYLLAKSDGLRRGLLWAFVLQATAFSVTSIAHKLSGSNQILWLYNDAEFWMGSPVFPYKNAAAAYQVLLVAFSMAGFCFVRERTGGKSVALSLSAVNIVLALVALLLLNCRAGVIMAFVLVLLFIFQEGFATKHPRENSPQRWPRILGIVILLACGGWLLARGGFAGTLRRFDSDLWKPIALLRGGEPRILKQKIAVEMAKDRPWFGWGGGAYLPLFLTYHPRVPEYLSRLIAEQPTLNRIHEESADGDWWEFLVEYGIIGEALLLVSIIVSVALWARAGGPRCCSSTYLIAAALLVTLHGTIDRILREEIVIATLGVTIALAIREARAQARKARVN